MEFKTLLSPIKIGNMEIKNRFVVPAMGTNFANIDGTVSQQMIDYYTARAKGGFGLIIIEVTAVEPRGKAILFEGGIWDDSQIEGLKKLVDSVHAAGAKVIVQLHHAGRQTIPPIIGNQQPIAPSSVPCPIMNVTPHAMTNDDVWQMIGHFGDAAVRAKKAGFDGVEVHGAHGYLVAQFMSPHANKRYDEFGGDFAGRMKFPMEIFKDIRKKVGRDYPMTFRFSYDEKVNGGRTIEESTVLARMAEEAGVDALNISIMTYSSMEYMSAPAAMPPGFNQHPTALIKASVNIPVISVGRYSNYYVAEDALRAGRADMIAIGRGSIADPSLPLKIKEGRQDEISPCISCLQSCIGYLNNPEKFKVSCLVNPCTGHEGEYDFSIAKTKKKVMVVGGGPGGLLAAWVAAKRGHDVSLYEKNSEFGGQFRLASIPPTKHEILSAIKYYLNMGKKHGVKYFTNTEVTPELVSSEKPDAVILATGGVQNLPNIKGIDGKNVVTCVDVLDAKVDVGNRVLIIGGGMSGSETADYIADHKKAVTIVEMQGMIAPDVEPGLRAFLLPRLIGGGVQMLTDTKVMEFLPDGAIVERRGALEELRGFDTVVLAMGAKPYNPLEEETRKLVEEVYVIGDAVKVAPANRATEAGLAAALKL